MTKLPLEYRRRRVRPARGARTSRALLARACLWLSIGRIAGHWPARQLGYNITAVPRAGAHSLHNHRVNEEMFFVLQGSGEVRIGGQTHPLRAGDILACPAGGTDTAHQIINTGTEELRYLAVSTKISPEICDYPDSGKFGIYDERIDTVDGKERLFLHLGRDAGSIDYWDGE